MDKASLTVFFEDPFWVGLYQRWEAGRYSVCRIVFGGEPRDCEVLEYLLQNFSRLPFSPALPAAPEPERAGNPKRRQREIARALRQPAGSTRARQALSLQREAGKERRKERSRAEQEAEAERRRALHVQKKKEKHRGR